LRVTPELPPHGDQLSRLFRSMLPKHMHYLSISGGT
jgi:hypothetical protein